MKAFKSKTINFSLFLVLLGAAQANLPAVQEFISPALYGYSTIIIAVIVAGLRSVTSKSLADK